jgi:multiple sugar transport system ATP-binding protein
VGQITLENVTKEFGGGVVAVDDVSLTVGEGEFMVLVGPSGCGKTTLLRSIGGLERVTAGRILIGERDVTKLDPAARDLAMVFQNYALYPHMSVRKNLGYSLRVKRTPRKEIRRRVEEVAKLLGLDDLLDRRPGALSGGQQQRVAMGRAIIREPAAFLMDEPLSNLDAKLRVQMRAEISQLQHNLGVTTIYVTHDQVEAMTMGDRVAVMRKGQLQQVAEPQDLYDQPVNLFVGGFIGSPAMNMLEATLERKNGQLAANFGTQQLAISDAAEAARPALRDFEGKMVIVGIRPEHLEDATIARDGGQPKLRGTVVLREALGSEIMVHFTVDARPALTEDVRELAADVGGDLPSVTHETTMVARFNARSRVREQEEADVAVDTTELHFFDPESGLGIYGRETTKGEGA